MHRLRHGLATHLVNEGKVLKARARLGHQDPSTTLRHYSHAVQLDDVDVADEIDLLLNVVSNPATRARASVPEHPMVDPHSRACDARSESRS